MQLIIQKFKWNIISGIVVRKTILDKLIVIRQEKGVVRPLRRCHLSRNLKEREDFLDFGKEMKKGILFKGNNASRCPGIGWV